MKIYFASGNAHKAEELQALAAAAKLEVAIVSAKTLGGMPHVEEDTGTFLGNARKKAFALRALAPAGAWVLADDSGLCVEALGGAPGVDSAYYAGPLGDAAANREKLMATMRRLSPANRGAYFYCLLLLIDPQANQYPFEGRCPGRIIDSFRGAGGFGYDPMFVPTGYERSLAELSQAEKNAVSHRGQAFGEFARWWADLKV
jgi:XTP/dITP diphosphohydrolase